MSPVGSAVKTGSLVSTWQVPRSLMVTLTLLTSDRYSNGYRGASDISPVTCTQTFV